MDCPNLAPDAFFITQLFQTTRIMVSVCVNHYRNLQKILATCTVHHLVCPFLLLTQNIWNGLLNTFLDAITQHCLKHSITHTFTQILILSILHEINNHVNHSVTSAIYFNKYF